MTQGPGPDDRTEHMPASDDSTQRIGPEDDATRSIEQVEDETQLIGASDDATQAIGTTHHHEPTATQPISSVTGPVAQRTERIVVPAAGGALGPWLIATLVVIGLIVGGVIGYMQTEPSADNVVARALVGPDGGAMAFDGVGRLEVPRNALPTATAITVRRETLDRRVRLGAPEDARSTVFEPGELDVYVFEPPDLQFQQPVRITLPRRTDAQAVLVDSEEGARVIPAEGKGDTVTLTTTSFAFE